MKSIAYFTIFLVVVLVILNSIFASVIRFECRRMLCLCAHFPPHTTAFLKMCSFCAAVCVSVFIQRTNLDSHARPAALHFCLQIASSNFSELSRHVTQIPCAKSWSWSGIRRPKLISFLCNFTQCNENKDSFFFSYHHFSYHHCFLLCIPHPVYRAVSFVMGFGTPAPLYKCSFNDRTKS